MGRDSKGKRHSKKICRVDKAEADESVFFDRLARIKRAGGDTVADMLVSFIGEGMNQLAPRTQKDYRGYITGVLLEQFGELRPDQVEPGHVARFLSWRERNGAGVVANREMACLSSAFNYGMRNGMAKWNPCRGVRRNKETPKERYVSNDEFLAYFNAATEPEQDLMAGLFLARMRPNEGRALLKLQITPQGILWRESKTGKRDICEWDTALRFFVTRAMSRTPESPRVFTNNQGSPWTHDGMQSAMRRIRGRAGTVESWTWHDLRAKGESDAEDSAGLLGLYTRATKRTSVR
ncbi:MAG: hypothetical protein AAF216_13745 [Pseudomonadota bacterium]